MPERGIFDAATAAVMRIGLKWSSESLVAHAEWSARRRSEEMTAQQEVIGSVKRRVFAGRRRATCIKGGPSRSRTMLLDRHVDLQRERGL